MQIPKEIQGHLSVTQYREAKARWDALTEQELKLRNQMGKLNKARANHTLQQSTADEWMHTSRLQKNAGEDLERARQNLEIDIRRHLASAQRNSMQETINQLMAAV